MNLWFVCSDCGADLGRHVAMVTCQNCGSDNLEVIGDDENGLYGSEPPENPKTQTQK